MCEIDPLLAIIERHMTNPDGTSKMRWSERHAMWLEIKQHVDQQNALAATQILLDLGDEQPDGA